MKALQNIVMSNLLPIAFFATGAGEQNLAFTELVL